MEDVGKKKTSSCLRDTEKVVELIGGQLHVTGPGAYGSFMLTNRCGKMLLLI